uniref:Uncharacterized protein n=1 Tax=Dicentrarchus labrax TaxID=13489 RepID=A0A8P4GMJ1_DICLA
MATASSLLSEEKFLCSVCLDVFTDPVTTPCGHNFCSACIHKYWDSSDMCQCPLCKRVFSPRPELLVNTVMSELAADYKTLVQAKASPPGTQLPETADVPCDICSEKKVNAVKSCLTCLASFCEVHLEPHRRVAGLKSHTLLDPVKNLDDRMCKTHSKITELYCRTDQACICVMCFKTDHKGHNVVPLEEEYEAVMARKDETVANIQKMIQSRSEKIAEIENSVDVSQKEAEKEKEASVQVFTDLIRSIQRSQAELVEVIEERYRATKQKAEGFLTQLKMEVAELVEVIEERYRATKQKAEGFLTQLKMEVAELESRSNQLEQLSQSEDHHHFLQSFPTLCSPLDKDWSNISVQSDLSFEGVRGAVTLLKQRVNEIMQKLPEIKMKRMREHAVDLTFDPDTAYCSLVISEDGKQVIEERYRATKQKAEGFLTQLKMEVAELESRSNQLEQLSQSEDHHHFLQSFPTLCSPLDKDWSNISVQSDLSFEGVRGAVTLLKQRVNEIMEELPEIKMKRMREHAVDLTFDPDTAFCSLVISEDGKQVICGDTKQSVPYNPKRFETCTEVLAKEGFTTGKFYYEVQVKGKTDWIVGVVRESINRKEKLPLSVKNGAWVIGLDDGIYGAFESKSVKLTLKKKLQKVGIFVAYEGGVVSFYNVNSKSHMFSFTGYHFTEKLYPYFGLQGNENGKNSAPLIITPVPQTH